MTLLSNYFVYIVYGLCCIFLCVINTLVRKKWFCISSSVFILLSFFLLLCLRSSSVGLDTIAYIKKYEATKEISNIKEYMWKNKPEFLYYGLLLLFSKYLSLPKIVFDVFNSTIVFISLFFAFKKTKNPVFSLTTFLLWNFFCLSFTAERQFVSIALSTMALSFFIFNKGCKRWIFYYLLIGTSIMYHASALVMIVCPPLLLMKIKKENILFIFIPIIFMKPFFEGIYSLYSMISKTYYTPTTSRSSIIMYLIIFFMIVFYMVFLRNKNDKLFGFTNHFFDEYDYKQNVSHILILFLYALFLAWNSANMSISRLSWYFGIGISLILDDITFLSKQKTTKILVECLMLTLLFFYFIYSLPNFGLIPYETKYF